MAITKLQLYNIAMLALGDRRLETLTDDRAERRDLDEVYTRGKGAVTRLLEQGQWNWAMRAVKLDRSASITPEFGFAYAFDIPTDYVRLNMISAGERFMKPLDFYEFEGEYIYADVDPLYIRYVSNANDWGGDFSRWPDTFSEWAGHWLATQIAYRTKGADEIDRLEARTKKLLIDARSKDVSAEPPRWPPLSSWASSRLGRSSRRDRGQTGSLTGN